ncbi:hypothetical protein B1L07_11980 [Stenotrophomonas acidaminiphila]|nr:hypothetical protein B1L07_11980 [Stenotrophomonas acidaminiphila]
MYASSRAMPRACASSSHSTSTPPSSARPPSTAFQRAVGGRERCTSRRSCPTVGSACASRSPSVPRQAACRVVKLQSRQLPADRRCMAAHNAGSNVATVCSAWPSCHPQASPGVGPSSQ